MGEVLLHHRKTKKQKNFRMRSILSNFLGKNTSARILSPLVRFLGPYPQGKDIKLISGFHLGYSVWTDEILTVLTETLIKALVKFKSHRGLGPRTR